VGHPVTAADNELDQECGRLRKAHFFAAIAAVLMIGGVAFVGTRSPADGPVPEYETTALRMRIDVSERTLYVEENGEVIGSYGVAVGKPGHATPRGSFAVRRVIWNPRWVPPEAEWARDKQPREPGDPKNPMGRVKVFFKEPDYYIHGTNEPGTIGSAASHGCVRMRNDDIIELSKLIMEHGGAPVEPGMVQRLINRVRQTREVRLTNPVPLRIQT
jgi:lipoprotein-anchoring transpeptidase ErfK/SrfK